LNNILAFPEKLAVVAIHNGVRETLAWVDEEEARRLLKERKVTLAHRRGQARSLIVLDKHPVERISFARAELKHAWYSHNRETPELLDPDPPSGLRSTGFPGRPHCNRRRAAGRKAAKEAQACLHGTTTT
jgi:hypothetical protein